LHLIKFICFIGYSFKSQKLNNIYIWGCFDNDIFWKKVGCFYMYLYLSLCHLLLVMLTIYSLNLSHSSKIWLSWLGRSFGKIVFCPSLKIEDYIFRLPAIRFFVRIFLLLHLNRESNNIFCFCFIIFLFILLKLYYSNFVNMSDLNKLKYILNPNPDVSSWYLYHNTLACVCFLLYYR
jgi:hypothetical protein